MKHTLRSGIFLFFFMGFFATVRPAKAMNIRASQDVTIPESEKIDGTLVVTGNTIVIDAPIDGDVVCVGQTVKITGSVTGDILCAAQSITITGDVGGSVRTISQMLTFDGGVERNVTSLAQTATFSENSLVQGEFSMWASKLSLSGQIFGGVYGGAEDVTVHGIVYKGMFIRADRLIIAEKAVIQGDVRYTSNQEASIAAGTVQGKVERTPLPVKAKQIREQKNTSIGSSAWFSRILWAIVVHIVVGMLMIALFPKHITTLLTQMRAGYGPNLLWGFLTALVVPMALVLLALTIIGIPFALLGFLAFLLLMAVARVLTALHIGMRLLRVGDHEEGKKLFGSLAIGVTILWVAFSIPLFGWLFSLLSLWLGMGALAKVILAKRK